MPISQLSETIQKAVMFLPGTYGTSLIKNHCMRGAFEELSACGLPDEAIESIKDALDCNLYFFDKPVSIPVMYAILAGSVALLVAVYIILNVKSKPKK